MYLLHDVVARQSPGCVTPKALGEECPGLVFITICTLIASYTHLKPTSIAARYHLTLATGH